MFDIGHGKGSFAFETAKAMLKGGFAPDIISSDVHTLCIDGPAYDNLETMSKFLSLGMPLVDLVRAVTETPAGCSGRPDLADLSVGSTGDATVLRIERGPAPLRGRGGRGAGRRTAPRPRQRHPRRAPLAYRRRSLRAPAFRWTGRGPSYL